MRDGPERIRESWRERRRERKRERERERRSNPSSSDDRGPPRNRTAVPPLAACPDDSAVDLLLLISIKFNPGRVSL